MNIADTGLHLENFKVFPKRVGVWEGNWIRLDADSKEIERFRGVVTKKIVNNQWIQTNTYHYADGTSVTKNFVGIVVGKGRVKIESSEPPFSKYTAIAEEFGENLVIFRVWDQATGVLIAVETINLYNDNTSVRTSQGFTAEGKFRGGTVITERKIG